MADQQPDTHTQTQPEPEPGTPATSRRRAGLSALALAVTVVVASGLTLLVTRAVTAPAEPQRPATSLDAASVTAPRPGPTAAQADPEVESTRLVISEPRELVGAASAGDVGAGSEVRVPLPALAAGTPAVLIQLSLLDAKGPGAVTLRTAAEEYPVLRAAAKGASTSATVVAMLGDGRDVRLVTEGGGRLQVDLVGTFEPARTSTTGRVVVTPATRLLTLVPGRDGNDVTVDLDDVPVLRGDGRVSAVLVRLSGDVGSHGGYAAVGPSASRLNQAVHWAATSGKDRTRPGFLVVPVRDGRFHLQYHAGTRLRVDLVGYVTGPRAPEAAEGLVVPVPAKAVTPVRVVADGRADVTVVSPGGIAGLTPDRVLAALLSLTATGDAPGGVQVGAPGSRPAEVPDLSAAAKARSALAVSGVVDGRVTVASDEGAAVIVTPRAFVISD